MSSSHRNSPLHLPSSPTGRDGSPPQPTTPGGAPSPHSGDKSIIEGCQSDLLDRKRSKPLSQSSPAKSPHIPAPMTCFDSELRWSRFPGILGPTCGSSSLDQPSGKVACSPRLSSQLAAHLFLLRDGGGGMLASGQMPT